MEVGLETTWSLAAADDAVVVVASPASESSKQRAKKSLRGAYAAGVELEAPRVETPKASMGWGMGSEYPPPQPTRAFVGAS